MYNWEKYLFLKNERNNMSIKRIMALAAAAAVALSAGCSIQVGTKNKTFADSINSIKLDDKAIIASPQGVEGDERKALEIDYLTFKKEYLYWMLTNGITDDTADKTAEAAAAQRSSIIEYLINEKIIATKAKELGVDTFTQEELDSLEADYQEKIKENIKVFSENADYGDLTEAEITDELKLKRGEEDFDKFLANALITREDLLMWQRSALMTEKLIEEVTKDVSVDRSEAEDTLNNYIETVKKLYEEEPLTYEAGGEYTSFWLPEGSRLVKHILIGFEESKADEISATRASGDEEGADALREEALKDIEQQTTEIKNMLDNGADFDELIEEYSDDAAGSKVFPDGYTVVPGSVSFVSEFVEAAFSIENVGEYVLAPSDYGYHIVMYNGEAKINEEDLTEYVDYIAETLQVSAENAKFDETMEKWRSEYNYKIEYDALGITPSDNTDTTDKTDSAA